LKTRSTVVKWAARWLYP